MSPYILGDAREWHKDSSATSLYDLVGVVNHTGAANYGHYTAHVRPENLEKGGLCSLRITLTPVLAQSPSH